MGYDSGNVYWQKAEAYKMTSKTFFSLLRYGLNPKYVDAVALSLLSKGDWEEIMRMAGQHSVLGLCMDYMGISADCFPG